MSVDISQFHATFLAEAGENLTELEAGLLALESGNSPDMNAIFRAAHSIKGGAATFGFNSIADFTHVVESVLEKARDGELEVTADLVTLLLKSLDIIGDLLAAAEDGGDTSAKVETQDETLEKLTAYMDGSGGSTAPSATTSAAGAEPADAEQRIMNITFKPKPNLLQTGCEPQNILRELAEMGDATITCHSDQVPPLTDIEPGDLYLWWEVELITSASDVDLQDVFLFVEDDADIDIETVAAIGPTPAADQDAGGDVATVTATPMGERRQGKDRRAKDRRAKGGESSYIRVAIDKIDNLINLVGELVTTNAMVSQHVNGLDADEHPQLSTATVDMSRHTRNLQEAIMSIRMLPVDFAFSRFPRMVRDTAQKLNKQVELVTTGGQTELDKTVIEQISDPLTHLVRNSVDHGIETPEERVAAGKDPTGMVELAAFYRGGNVVIEIRDDGKGLSREKIVAKAIEKGVTTQADADKMSDEDVWNFIFESGFSTAAAVTDVSGRGVGMDVVRKNIHSLGGSIHIQSKAGEGSVFSISLPLTLAILDGMATKVGDDIYIVPLLSILESLRPAKELTKAVKKDVEVIDFRGEYVPLLRLSEVMRISGGAPTTALEEGIAVVVENEHGKVALFVDDLLGECQVVIKSIEKNYRSVRGVSGATIMGDGNIALILDLGGLIKLAMEEGRYTKPFMDPSFKKKKESPATAAFGLFDDDQPAPASQPEPEEVALESAPKPVQETGAASVAEIRPAEPKPAPEEPATKPDAEPDAVVADQTVQGNSADELTTDEAPLAEPEEPAPALEPEEDISAVAPVTPTAQEPQEPKKRRQTNADEFDSGGSVEHY